MSAEKPSDADIRRYAKWGERDLALVDMEGKGWCIIQPAHPVYLNEEGSPVYLLEAGSYIGPWEGGIREFERLEALMLAGDNALTL